MVVVTQRKHAFQVGSQCIGGEKPQKGIDIEISVDLFLEFGLSRLMYQSGERHDSLRLLFRRFLLGPVESLVSLPIVTEVLDSAHLERLQ